MDGGSLSRRDFLAGAAAGALLGVSVTARAAGRSSERAVDFGALAEGDGWPGWTCPGVARLRRAGGPGSLDAGSDVLPCDPRPVAFAVDQRFVDGEVPAELVAAGAGPGVVVRRVAPRAFYAAIFDDEQAALVLVRRSPDGIQELARTAAVRPLGA